MKEIVESVKFYKIETNVLDFLNLGNQRFNLMECSSYNDGLLH